jgi:hypothetical protein
MVLARTKSGHQSAHHPQGNRALPLKLTALAYKTTDQDALRAYHLARVVSKFEAVISAENAELPAVLLGSDEDEEGSPA